MVPAANPPTTPAATSQPPAWALETSASASGSSPSVRQFPFAFPGRAGHVGGHQVELGIEHGRAGPAGGAKGGRARQNGVVWSRRERWRQVSLELGVETCCT